MKGKHCADNNKQTNGSVTVLHHSVNVQIYRSGNKTKKTSKTELIDLVTLAWGCRFHNPINIIENVVIRHANYCKTGCICDSVIFALVRESQVSRIQNNCRKMYKASYIHVMDRIWISHICREFILSRNSSESRKILLRGIKVCYSTSVEQSTAPLSGVFIAVKGLSHSLVFRSPICILVSLKYIWYDVFWWFSTLHLHLVYFRHQKAAMLLLGGRDGRVNLQRLKNKLWQLCKYLPR